MPGSCQTCAVTSTYRNRLPSSPLERVPAHEHNPSFGLKIVSRRKLNRWCMLRWSIFTTEAISFRAFRSIESVDPLLYRVYRD